MIVRLSVPVVLCGLISCSSLDRADVLSSTRPATGASKADVVNAIGLPLDVGIDASGRERWFYTMTSARRSPAPVSSAASQTRVGPHTGPEQSVAGKLVLLVYVFDTSGRLATVQQHEPSQ